MCGTVAEGCYDAHETLPSATRLDQEQKQPHDDQLLSNLLCMSGGSTRQDGPQKQLQTLLTNVRTSIFHRRDLRSRVATNAGGACIARPEVPAEPLLVDNRTDTSWTHTRTLHAGVKSRKTEPENRAEAIVYLGPISRNRPSRVLVVDWIKHGNSG